MPQPCARRAHRQPPTEQHSTIVGRIYPIQMYTPQTNNTPQLLAEHIQYKYISQNMYMPQPCARRAHRQPQTEQHSTTVGRIYPVKCTPPNWTIVGSTFPILYVPMHFSICVIVLSGMTPQNIIFDIPLQSYYPKYSMCLCYSPLEVCTFVFVYLYL